MAHLDATRKGAFLEAESVGKEVLVAGVSAGVLAGVAMAAWLILSAARAGMEPLAPLRLMGALFRGSETLEGGVGLLISGTLVHLAASAAVGVLFAAMVSRDFPAPSATVVGLGYAAVVLVVLTSVVFPAVNPVLREQLLAFGGAWVVAHAAFGVTLGVTPWLRRRIAAQPTGAGRLNATQRGM